MISWILFATAAHASGPGAGGALRAPLDDTASRWVSPEHAFGCAGCHRPDGGTSAALCTACHLDVGQQLRAGVGFHGTGRVACGACHPAHRPPRPPHPPTLDFDHGVTGFELTGAHATAPCGDCHRTPEVGYLGLSPACAGCHEGPHGGGASTGWPWWPLFAAREDPRWGACEACHVSSGWTPK